MRRTYIAKVQTYDVYKRADSKNGLKVEFWEFVPLPILGSPFSCSFTGNYTRQGTWPASYFMSKARRIKCVKLAFPY